LSLTGNNGHHLEFRVIERWQADPAYLLHKNRDGLIDQAIRSAHIILLLISADFLASDLEHHSEMQQALERHKRGEARVIPILVESRPIFRRGNRTPSSTKGRRWLHLRASASA
jgi:type IV secretory pathway VirD2 relaxase